MDILIKKWDEILKTLQIDYDIKDASVKIWLRPLKIYKIEDRTLYMVYGENSESADQLGIDYIKRKYEKPLISTIATVTDLEFDEIIFILPNKAKEISTVKENNDISSSKLITNNITINPKFTFDNFVVGQNNKFAQTAAVAVADSPGGNYNPLYIYGGPGLGKTHLMHAIGNFIKQQNPNTKILYVTSETFVNEVIENIRGGNNSSSMAKIRDKYRSVDVLMVDDIQFIIGKDATQQEFFNTFNALHEEGKQIIISSDKPPKEMEALDERFRSRFNMGLMADIGIPDYETRMAIIKRKSEERKFTLSENVMHYIAENIKSNIRDIEGALNSLIAYSNFGTNEITIEIAVEQLQNYISPNQVREITPQLIIEIVADHFNITVDQMASKNRSSSVVRPRQIAMYLCNNMTDTSLKAIGTLLGGRDHSTIIHGATKISEDIEADEATKVLIETLKAKIKPN